MYYPSKYDEHNESLKRFVKLFNETAGKLGGRIVMRIRENENFRDDGIIQDCKTDMQILFDWEKRQSYYTKCGFPFDTFGQFERKIKKEEILLSIQCSQNEDCFCIAWHEDFKDENIEFIPSATESGEPEFTGKRFTKKFLELRYDEMDKFYKILENAFDRRTFNSTTFKLGD